MLIFIIRRTAFKKIIISSRNKKISQNLKKRFKKIIIAKNNKQIVDNCDWVFLSITPIVGQKIDKELRINSNQTIISLISNITVS